MVFTDSIETNKLLHYKTKLTQENFEVENHESNIIDYEQSEPLKNQANYFINAISTRICEINNVSHGRKVVEVLEKSSELL